MSPSQQRRPEDGVAPDLLSGLPSDPGRVPYESSTEETNSQAGTARQYSTCLVRAARLEDLSNIATLLSESFYPEDALLGWLSPLLRIGISQDLRSRLSAPSPNQVCLVAIQGDAAPGDSSYCALVGTVEVTLRSLSSWQSFPKYPYVSNLAVKADSRRQGVAQHLLQTCERTVLEWGFRGLYLHVLENNQPARWLYTKAGYQVDRLDPLWTTYLFGPQRLLLHRQLR